MQSPLEDRAHSAWSPAMAAWWTLWLLSSEAYTRSFRNPEACEACFSPISEACSTLGNNIKNEQWDEENMQKDGNDHVSDESGADSDNENLRSPLLSRQGTNTDEHVNSMGIGGGWQLAYRKDEKISGGLKRIYLHQEGVTGSRRGSVASLSVADVVAAGEMVHASALVSQFVLRTGDITDENLIGVVQNKKPDAS